MQIMSTMQVTPGQSVMRIAVTTAHGEKIVLTIDLRLEERHEPAFRGFATSKRWAISSVSGEPWAALEALSEPTRDYGPESVTKRQLLALG